MNLVDHTRKARGYLEKAEDCAEGLRAMEELGYSDFKDLNIELVRQSEEDKKESGRAERYPTLSELDGEMPIHVHGYNWR